MPLVTRFAQAGAVAMFGAHSSPVALAQADAVEAAGMPEFVFGASNAIDNPFQYQVNARDSEQIKNVINFAKQHGFTRSASSPTPARTAPRPRSNSTPFSADPICRSSAPRRSSRPPRTSTPQLVALRRQNPDFIAMFSFGTPYSAVVKGKAEIGWDVPVIGNVAAGDIAIGEIAGKDADGLYYMTPLATSPRRARSSPPRGSRRTRTTR